MLVSLVLSLLACKSPMGDSDTDPGLVDTDDGRVIPPVTASRSSVLGHAEECQQALGPIPGFDCIAETVPMPITLDGAPATFDPGECDKPSLLEGSCNRWTRVGRKTGTWMNGDPRPEVTFIFTCRSYDYEEPHADGGLYHDVAMIGHNAETGATCFFQSFPEARQRYFPSPLTAGGTPDYGTRDARMVWDRPGDTASIACHRCHGSDPWIHSPWIDQLEDPANPGQPFVPPTGSNNTPYHVVGTEFARWRLTQIAPEGNACLACHRMHPGPDAESFIQYSVGGDIGMPLTGTSTTWPASHWMPPEDGSTPEDFAALWQPHVDQLLECTRTPNAAVCNRQPVPEGERYIDPEAPPRDTGFEPNVADTALECAVPDGDLGSALGSSLASGDTCGAGHDYVRSCGEFGTAGEDRGYRWSAPHDGTFVFDTLGSSFDTTLSAREDCAVGDGELACNDDVNTGQLTQSRIQLALQTGQTIVLVVDTYDSDCGEFVLNITEP
ncbi:MAG: hypothetical protein R3F61_12925 [Myxococcota bacterium]